MNVESKEFLLKVKEEYVEYANNKFKYYICNYSDTFSHMWNDTSQDRQDGIVIEYAREFLKEINVKYFNCRCGLLFDNVYICNHIHIEIRQKFINHMINKYS